MSLKTFLRRYWQKIVVIIFGMFLLAAPLLFAFYLGFWVAKWTSGLRLLSRKQMDEENMRLLDEVEVKMKEVGWIQDRSVDHETNGAVPAEEPTVVYVEPEPEVPENPEAEDAVVEENGEYAESLEEGEEDEDTQSQ